MVRELVIPHWRRLEYAYRLTHIENISHILKFGLVHPTSVNMYSGYVPIGDSSIIKIREEELHHGYRLSDYIPFYFGPRSPMLFVIQNGWNGVTKYDAGDLVYCAVKIDTVTEQNMDCIFTDGHAVAAITEFYSKGRLTDLNTLVKVDDVFAKYWKDDSDLDLERRKQAELLVKDEIPPQYIAGFFVYNENAKQKLIEKGVPDDRIYVAPDYYF